MANVVEIPAGLNRLLRPLVVPLVRLGNPHDGGYLVPEAVLQPPLAVVSLGMKDDWSFEQSIVRRHPDTVVHSYDPTVSLRTMLRSIVKGVRLLLTGRNLTLWGRSKVLVGYLTFFRGPRRVHFREWVGESADHRQPTPCDAVLGRVRSPRSIVLKIDIEGSEYAFLEELLRLDSMSRVLAIVVEFHDLDTRWAEFEALQDRLLARFDLVHVHANNMNKVLTSAGIPRVLELSFARRTDDRARDRRSRLPLDGLDFPNDLGAEDYALQFADG